MKDINKLVRNNIKNLKPYSSARSESNGLNGSIYLDANESPFGPFNRYPDPKQIQLKNKIGHIKKIPTQNIFIGNGSDEAIDLLIRIFCEPRTDNIIILPPTYGMYEVSASIQDIEVKKIPLTSDFQPDKLKIFIETNRHSKIIFICSPNNPTGNHINRADILALLKNFKGIIVIDEAYIDFSDQPSFTEELSNHKNLVILQTFSKAWGLAALRLGIAFACPEIIQYMNKIKYPYNINSATQQLALEALDKIALKEKWTSTTIEQRDWLRSELGKIPCVQKILPSDANFLYVKTRRSKNVFDYLKSKGIVVRYKDGLRITIGTPEENKLLIKTLAQYEEGIVSR